MGPQIPLHHTTHSPLPSVCCPQVGDQILEVNGKSCLNIPHDEAVKLLKSSRHLIMTVKDIGRVPHARTTVDETKWINSAQTGETAVNPARFVYFLVSNAGLLFLEGPASL